MHKYLICINISFARIFHSLDENILCYLVWACGMRGSADGGCALNQRIRFPQRGRGVTGEVLSAQRGDTVSLLPQRKPGKPEEKKLENQKKKS